MKRHHARGFSVVELMVAMTIGLILIGGALSVLYSSKVTYSENERVGRLQETGRAAVELMLRDLRAGGFKGCSANTLFTNALGSTDVLSNFAVPVQGFDYQSSASWSPTINTTIIPSARDGSDIFAIRTTRLSSPTFTTNAAMANATADVSVDRNGTDSVPTGSTLMISDCSAAAVFAVSAFTGGTGTATIAHLSTDLGIAFGMGARVVPVDTVIYYIRDSGTTRNGVKNPSLWRRVGSAAPQELIEGVENMQILYGVDTDGDRLVDSYVPASDAAVSANWNRVISVSIGMLIRSIEPNSIMPDTQTYTLLDPLIGAKVGPFNDRYQRTLYTTTVALRNTTS
jgi:type IV pilus assembly protein PilW